MVGVIGAHVPIGKPSVLRVIADQDSIRGPLCNTLGVKPLQAYIIVSAFVGERCNVSVTIRAGCDLRYGILTGCRDDSVVDGRVVAPLGKGDERRQGEVGEKEKGDDDCENVFHWFDDLILKKKH